MFGCRVVMLLLLRWGGNGMQIDSVLFCSLQLDSYEAGGGLGVDGAR